MGLALYVGVVWYIGWQGIHEAIAGLELRYLLLLMVFEAGAIGLRILKWRIALGRDRNIASLFLLSKAAGGWSPSRLGELSPLLIRQYRTPRIAAWLVLDRLLEIAATLGLGVVGVVSLVGLPVQRRYAMAATALVAMVVLFVGPLYLLTRRRLFLDLARRFAEPSLAHRAGGMMAAVGEEILGFRKLAPAISVLTVLATAADVAKAVMLYRSLGYWVPFALLATVQCAHGIVSAIPFTPNATGVPYFVAAGIVHQLGGVPVEVVTVAVGVFFVSLNLVFWTLVGLTGALRLRSQVEEPMVHAEGDRERREER